MFVTLFTKEILNHLRSLRFMFGTLVLAALVITSIFILSIDVSDRIENQQVKDRSEEEYISKYAHLNRINYLLQPGRPVERTEVLFRGLDDPRLDDSFFGDLLTRLFPRFDIIFIISILLSLLALVYSYDGICGEREEGILKLIHTGAVSRFSVISAKWAGVMAVLFVPFLLFTLAGILVASFTGELALSQGLIAETGLILLAVLFYVGIFTAAGLLISSLAKRSGTSILFSLLVWVVFVLVIPNVSPILASQIEPLPSVNAVERETRMLTDVIRDNRLNEEVKKLSEQLRAEHDIPPTVNELHDPAAYVAAGWPEDRAREVADGFVQAYRAIIDRVNAEQREKANAIYQELERKIERQQELTKWLSLVSPTPAFTYFATDIASVGLRAEEYFYEEVSEWASEFNEFADERHKREEERLGRRIGANEFIDLAGRPRFTHHPESLLDRFSGVAFYLGHLTVYMMVVFAGAVLVYQRYDIR
jgi:ABC-type transport system involved in multi-copper enzyme maturation permease subunit